MRYRHAHRSLAHPRKQTIRGRTRSPEPRKLEIAAIAEASKQPTERRPQAHRAGVPELPYIVNGDPLERRFDDHRPEKQSDRLVGGVRTLGQRAWRRQGDLQTTPVVLRAGAHPARAKLDPGGERGWVDVDDGLATGTDAQRSRHLAADRARRLAAGRNAGQYGGSRGVEKPGARPRSRSAARPA